MKQDIKFSGRLKSYLNWPIFFVIILLAMSIAVFLFDVRAGFIAAGCSLACLILVVLLLLVYKPPVMKEMVAFASSFGALQNTIIDELAIPYGVLDADGKLLWMNAGMREVTGKDNGYHKHISTLFPVIAKEKLPQGSEPMRFDVSIGDMDFSAEVKRVSVENWTDSTPLVEVPLGQAYLYTISMLETTELNRYIREKEEDQLVAGLIYIDNYEEVLESIDDVRCSLLLALIDRKIDKFITHHKGIMKKLDKDKYYIIIQKKYLTMMESTRFSLLDDVKTVNIGNDMKVTLSIGIGVQGESYVETYTFAHQAIEMALGRGGDQAVVKAGDTITYFGGKSLSMEKSTRVKARVKAQALREFISAKDDVIIMGHKVTDIDTLGAAIGIYRAARSIGKRAYIVIDEDSNAIRPYLKNFQNKDYEPDLFINQHKAQEILDDHTVLVVVDTNRPSNTECPALLDKATTIVVLDHHRQGTEVIKNATLSYIEPYASSACEMVAEILQYFNEGTKLVSCEADCVYAGILVDTNNFVAKTGIRTFEAAAYLRRCGADVTRVRKLMRNDMDSYKARAEAVRNAELYRDCYAISVLPHENLDSPTIVGAQAANELLNITGVKASFVLTKYHDRIYISARSIDELNVQVVMERLGGGGHMNIAGAQIADQDAQQVISAIKNTLDTMIKEGAI